MDFRQSSKYGAIGIAVIALLSLILNTLWSSLFVFLTILAVLIHLLTWKRTKKVMVQEELREDRGFESLFKQVSNQAKKSFIIAEKLRRIL